MGELKMKINRRNSGELTQVVMGFTLIEILIVVSILGILMALLLPAISSARESARLLECKNHLRQIGLALHSFESAHGSFPRAGETIVFYPNSSTLRKSEDYHSPFVMILPHIEQNYIFNNYNLDLRYNELPNTTASMNGIATYLCPSNKLTEGRNGSVDIEGFGVVDYSACPYTDILPNGREKGGDSFLKAAALMGAPYPNRLYTDYAVSGNPPCGTADSTVASNKQLCLDPTKGKIDPYYGGSKIASIADGTSNCLAFYEDNGRSSTIWETSGGYLDTITCNSSRDWRFGEGGSASGVSKKINNNKSPWLGPPSCPWNVHDCGPNNEIFSFHNANGASVLLMDGRVIFLKETMQITVLRALITKNGSDQVSPDDL
jgi:prepilin-type N-terminal cleavage/methylation domain-containing protein